MNLNREPTFLEWDTRHFGYRVATFFPQEFDEVKSCLEWCRSQKIKMLMARCDITNIPVIHELERNQFLLMDTYVRYSFDFSKKEIPKNAGAVPIRPARESDVQAVANVSREAFRGFPSHFVSDVRIDGKMREDMYAEWAANSCRDKKVADQVFVAEQDDEIVGFITIKKIENNAGDGVLAGVHTKAQKQGIYRSFIIRAMQWCKEEGLGSMELNPVLNNFSVQRVWQRLGFEIYRAGHTFHLWFD